MALAIAPVGDAHTEPGDLVLGIDVIDDDDGLVAICGPLRGTPPAVLVCGRPHGAVALALGPLDLQAAFATLPPADRVVVDRGIETELHGRDLLATLANVARIPAGVGITIGSDIAFPSSGRSDASPHFDCLTPGSAHPTGPPRARAGRVSRSGRGDPVIGVFTIAIVVVLLRPLGCFLLLLEMLRELIDGLEADDCHRCFGPDRGQRLRSGLVDPIETPYLDVGDPAGIALCVGIKSQPTLLSTSS